jgi:hypothetical protein
MEVLVLAVFVRLATPPAQNLASAGMCRHCLALDGACGRIAAAGLRAELLECCFSSVPVPSESPRKTEASTKPGAVQSSYGQPFGDQPQDPVQ